jgi:DNA (cytosine-5)-methyltransferase 1
VNLLDLFSGIGGFHLGLEQAGFEFDYVGFSDIDKYANKQYKKRFPDAEELGSVTDVQPKRLPNIDIITFGFPCQDLSIAGKRGGLQANRSSLFFEAMRIVGAKRPKYFIFENVKGLFSSNEGQDFDLILRTIAEFGYDGGWQLLNTRWFLPQNRERVYFVGHIRGEPRPKVFPIGEGNCQNNKAQGISNNTQYSKTITTAHAHGTAKHMSYIDEGLKQIGTIGEDSEATRVYDPNGCARDYKDPKLVKVADYRTDEGIRIRNDGDAPCLTASHHSENEPSRMQGLVISGAIRGRDDNPSGNLELRKDDVSNTIINNPTSSLVVKPVLTPNREEKRQNGRRFKEDGEDMFTLTSQDQHGVMIEEKKINIIGGTQKNAGRMEDCSTALTKAMGDGDGHVPIINQSSIRRLTPTECEKLQGFPDGWTEGQSDTQRYKQLGNAVSVPVVKAIGEKLIKEFK